MADSSPVIGHQGLIAVSLRVVERLKTIVVFALIIEIALVSFNMIRAYDFSWQLAEGRALWVQGKADPSVLNAYGEISPHFSNEYIFYEMILYGINSLAGWRGLCLFFGLLIYSLYAPCLLAFCRARHRFSVAHVLVFLLAQFIINLHVAARPELIAFVCYLVLGILLLGREGKSWSWGQLAGLGLLFCLWGNAHGSFLIGLTMLGLWYVQDFCFRAGELWLRRDYSWFLPGLVAVAGVVLNPAGVFRLIQPFELHSLLWGQATSSEMWPLRLGLAALPVLGTAVGLVLLMRACLQGQRVYWTMALLVLLLALTFVSVRYEGFIGISLLVVLWNELRRLAGSMGPSKTVSLPLAFGKALVCSAMALVLLSMITFMVKTRRADLEKNSPYFFPHSLVPTHSSFVWLRTHSGENDALLSGLNAASWSQMPGYGGIHPLLDSGTHRYSDRTNQLYYYSLFSPELLRRILDRLEVNAVIVSGATSNWAPVLNANPAWSLAWVAEDSQLYLRKGSHPVSDDRELFSRWEAERLRGLADFKDVSGSELIRGLGLRPDTTSLQILRETRDVSWLGEPSLSFIQDWLKRAPDPLIQEALARIPEQAEDDSTQGARILFLLRLGQGPRAAAFAEQWHPSILSLPFIEMQELRAEAFLAAGKSGEARAILQSLWPRPRYSLRWAELCRRVYGAGDPALPRNARLLAERAENVSWLDDLIPVLNLNIESLRQSSR